MDIDSTKHGLVLLSLSSVNGTLCNARALPKYLGPIACIRTVHPIFIFIFIFRDVLPTQLCVTESQVLGTDWPGVADR